MRHPIVTNILLILSGSLRIVKLLFSIIAAVIIVSTAAFAGIYFSYARNLPDIRTLEDYRPPVISEAFAADGTKIGEFWTECRIYLPYDKIPVRVRQAFVDSEDSRFWEHKGVDMRSIIRAFVANLKSGEFSQGGSTITQQITRSLLLTREKSLDRKIKEAILATRIERYLNKEQILTLYLNQIYLGNRAYGVAAAARNYFKKPLEELTLGQIALIAGLPTAPTNYSPVNNRTEARKRQQHVLSRMLEEGHITAVEAKNALAETFTVYVAGIDKDFTDKDAAYFTEHVRRIVKEKYGDDVLYHKGLKIYTTVDPKMQRAAVASVRGNLEKLDRRLGWRGPIETVAPEDIDKKARQFGAQILAKQQGEEIPWPPAGKNKAVASIVFTPGETYHAVVTGFADKDTQIRIGDAEGTIKIDGMKWAHPWHPGSIGYEGAGYVNNPKQVLKVGDVILARFIEDSNFALAQDPLIQSALMALETKTGYIRAMQGGYDFAKSEFNRVTQALRQPGSSVKPYIYASALDKGYTFNTVVVDNPISFPGGAGKAWTPKNYGGGYNGPTPFRNCLIFSRNVPTVKIVYDIGTHYLTGYMRKMGLTSPVDKYLSMALGANGVYLYEHVQAYTVFPNNGILRPATAILKIEDNKGNVLEEYTPPGSDGSRPTEVAVEQKAEGDENKEEAAPAAESREPITLGKAVSETDLNPGLVSIAEESIKKDGLNLTDLEIKTLYGNNIPPGHVITPQTAFLMVNLMKGVVESGTGQRVKVLGRPVAGKTGTTNDETDVWFVGYTPDLAAGAWVGFDEVQKIGGGIQGSNTAAPVFIDFMKVALEGTEPKNFQKPEGFPEGDINNLTGGSSLFGSMPKKSFPGSFDSGDRAGEFFEEDFESFGH